MESEAEPWGLIRRLVKTASGSAFRVEGRSHHDRPELFYCRPRIFLLQKSQQFACGLFGRCRILACHQLAVCHNERGPVSAFMVFATIGRQHILDQEGHDIRQPDTFFLGIGKTGDLLAGNERLWYA